MNQDKCKYSIDDYLDEELIKIINKTNMCSWLTPNMVTMFGILKLYPLYYAVKNKKYFMVFIIIILRTIIDSLDGNLARTCKKTSLIGSYLDLISDSIGVAIIIYFMVLKCFNLQPDIKYLFIISVCIYLLFDSGVDTSTHKPNNKLMEIGRSNSILLSVLLYCSWLICTFC